MKQAGSDSDRKEAADLLIRRGINFTHGELRLVLAEYVDKNQMIDIESIISEGDDDSIQAFSYKNCLICIRKVEAANDGDIADTVRLLEDAQYIVYSAKIPRYEELNQNYKKACAIMDYLRTTEDEKKVVSFSDLDDKLYEPFSYPLAIMQELEMTISQGKIDHTKKLVSRIIDLMKIKNAPSYYIKSLYFNSINQIMNGITELSDQPEFTRRFMIEAAAYDCSLAEMISILQETTNVLESLLSKKESNGKVMRMEIDFIMDRISSPDLSLKLVADYAGLSVSAFSRNFKESVGMNFKEFVDEARLNIAKEKLENSELPIEDVGVLIGYDTVSSFYRFFRKNTGVAPGEYRAINGKKQK